jgi:hypothetical protein
MDQIDELNSLCADLLDGKIEEAKFRRLAVGPLWYELEGRIFE